LVGGQDPAPTVVPKLAVTTYLSSYLIGDQMLETNLSSPTPRPLVHVTPTTQTTVVGNVAVGTARNGINHQALVVGGAGPGDWSVRRFTLNGGDVTQSDVVPLTAQSNAGLTISQGMMRHIEVITTAVGTTHYQMYNHEL